MCFSQYTSPAMSHTEYVWCPLCRSFCAVSVWFCLRALTASVICSLLQHVLSYGLTCHEVSIGNGARSLYRSSGVKQFICVFPIILSLLKAGGLGGRFMPWGVPQDCLGDDMCSHVMRMPQALGFAAASEFCLLTAAVKDLTCRVCPSPRPGVSQAWVSWARHLNVPGMLWHRMTNVHLPNHI